MNSPASDPLLSRIARYVELSPEEAEELAVFTRTTQTVTAGERLLREAEPSHELFVVLEGRLFTSIALGGAVRQILRIHHPGDFINVTCLAWSRTAATVTAATDGCVSRVPRAALTAVFDRRPRLAAIFYGLSTVDNVVMADRLASLGRTDGRSRLAALLLELWSREQVTEEDEPSGELRLHLSQAEIADAVGMSKVHLNRVLNALTADGLIERDGRSVQLLDLERLKQVCGFVDRHEALATDWYPASSAR